MDGRPGPRETHGVDGPSPSPVVGTPRDWHDALHLQGQLDTGLRRGDTDGVRELAMRLITSGTARRFKGVPERIVWYCTVFLSESDFMLYCSTHRGSRVDGSLLRPTTNKVESRKCAGQVALGHVSTIIMFELPRVVRRLPGGFTLGRARSHTNITINHDAVHGLRAAAEPDAALRETVAVSQFATLVQ